MIMNMAHATITVHAILSLYDYEDFMLNFQFPICFLMTKMWYRFQEIHLDLVNINQGAHARSL